MGTKPCSAFQQLVEEAKKKKKQKRQPCTFL